MHRKILNLNKQVAVIISLVIIVFIDIAGTTVPIHKKNFKNLKILPQDISNEKLHRVMDEFNQSLGVKCNYCHAPKDSLGHIDFASDSNSTKEAARDMMRMSIQINKEFLMVKHPMIGDSTMVVTCYTCHHGTPFPDRKIEVIPVTKHPITVGDTILQNH